MRWYRPECGAALCAALTLAAPRLAAQTTAPLDSLVLRLSAMSAVTGYEDAMADSLLALLPGSARDRGGNVVWSAGSGDPLRIAICPMDEVGYVVGSITPEGYLTLRRVGATAVGPLFDQFIEGQRVTVFGRRGAVPAVVGVRSTHLTRGRPSGDDAPFPLDQAYVDVGATSPGGVTTLGIETLAPVTRAKAPHRYGTDQRLVAAPWVAQRAACAALAAAARGLRPGTGTAIAVFAARRHFANDGASFALWERDPSGAASVVLLGNASPQAPGAGPQAASDSLLAGRARRTVASWALPARFPRTPVETISLNDVAELERRLGLWLRGEQ